MKKQSIIRVLSLALILSLAVTGCYGGTSPSTPGGQSGSSAGTSAPPAGTADMEVYTGEDVFEALEWSRDYAPNATVIRFAENTPTASFQSVGGAIPVMVLTLAKELPVLTEGRYRIELFPDGTLASSTTEFIGGVQSGAFEIASIVAGSWGEYTDAFAEVNIPFLIKSYDAAEKLLLDHGLQEKMFEKAEQDVGVKFLAVNTIGIRQLTNSKRPVKTPDDIRGLKLRVMSDPIQVATFEALGASVVSIAYSELFTSLQQGVVDGQENPPYNIFNDKLFEVQPYMTMTNHLYSPSPMFINMSFWNNMSAEDQTTLKDLCMKGQELGLQKIASLEEYYNEQCEAAGMEITYLTPEEIQPFQDLLVAEVYPQSAELMGQERWDALMEMIEAVDKELAG